MGGYKSYRDNEITAYLPDYKDVSQLNDYEQEEIKDRKTHDDYLEDEWYKEEDKHDE